MHKRLPCRVYAFQRHRPRLVKITLDRQLLVLHVRYDFHGPSQQESRWESSGLLHCSVWSFKCQLLDHMNVLCSDWIIRQQKRLKTVIRPFSQDWSTWRYLQHITAFCELHHQHFLLEIYKFVSYRASCQCDQMIHDERQFISLTTWQRQAQATYINECRNRGLVDV